MSAFVTNLSVCGLASLLLSTTALAQSAAPSTAPTAAPAPKAETSPGPAPAELSAPSAEPAAEPVASEPVASEPVAPAVAPNPDPASYESSPAAEAGLNEETPRPQPELVDGPVKPDHQNAKFYFGLQWDTAMGVGSTYRFVDTFEPGGFAFEARYMGCGRLGFGLLIANQFMNAKGDHEIVRGNVTLSGTQVRSLSISPLYARLHYSLRDIRKHESRRKITPYAAFGFGGARVFRRLDMGISSYSLESWHWAFSPELGIQLPGDRMALTLSSRFNYLAASDGGPEQLYFNFSLGGGFF